MKAQHRAVGVGCVADASIIPRGAVGAGACTFGGSDGDGGRIRTMRRSINASNALATGFAVVDGVNWVPKSGPRGGHVQTRAWIAPMIALQHTRPLLPPKAIDDEVQMYACGKHNSFVLRLNFL